MRDAATRERPIGLVRNPRFAMGGSDRCFRLYRPRGAQRQSLLEQPARAADGVVVPVRAVLLGQGDRVSLRIEPCVSAGVVGEEQSQELVLEASEHLRLGNRDARLRAELRQHINRVAVTLDAVRPSSRVPSRPRPDRARR
jgi:hypothetical protein